MEVVKNSSHAEYSLLLANLLRNHISDVMAHTRCLGLGQGQGPGMLGFYIMSYIADTTQ